MKLTDEELLAIHRHGLSIDDVLLLECYWIPSSSQLSKAKTEGRKLYIGRRCKKAKHRLRYISSGHCFQCNPANLAFSTRHSSEGFVYIAGSLEKQLIKIGFCNSIWRRQETLRKREYAGAMDWKIICYIRAETAGEIESKTIRALANFRMPKQGAISGPQEAFRCSFSAALEALISARRSVDITEGWLDASVNLDLYEFC